MDNTAASIWADVTPIPMPPSVAALRVEHAKPTPVSISGATSGVPHNSPPPPKARPSHITSVAALETLLASARQAAPSTQDDEVACPAGFEVGAYNHDFSQHHAILSEHVQITRGSIKYVDHHARYGAQTRFRFQLCHNYLLRKCPKMSECSYIHATQLPAPTQVHLNPFAPRRLAADRHGRSGDVAMTAQDDPTVTAAYECMPPGWVVDVHPPQGNQISAEVTKVPSELLFKTVGAVAAVRQGGTDASGAPLPANPPGDPSAPVAKAARHCTKFQYRRACPQGPACRDIHSKVPFAGTALASGGGDGGVSTAATATELGGWPAPVVDQVVPSAQPAGPSSAGAVAAWPGPVDAQWPLPGNNHTSIPFSAGGVYLQHAPGAPPTAAMPPGFQSVTGFPGSGGNPAAGPPPNEGHVNYFSSGSSSGASVRPAPPGIRYYNAMVSHQQRPASAFQYATAPSAPLPPTASLTAFAVQQPGPSGPMFYGVPPPSTQPMPHQLHQPLPGGDGSSTSSSVMAFYHPSPNSTLNHTQPTTAAAQQHPPSSLR